jgi:hypothetical protein
MRGRSFLPWVLVATTSLGGLGIGPVLAQAIKEPGWPPAEGAACKPSKADDDEARTLFQLAEKAENTSNYTDAIKYYKDAYKRACNRHLLLKNLGRAYEKDAQYAAAVEAYKLYRARGKPTGEELDLIDAKIANLSKKVPETTATPTETTTSTAPTTTSTTTGTATTTTTAAPTSTETPSGGGIPIAPLIVTGVGAALLIGGTVVWIGANGTVSDKQDQFAENGCNVEKIRLPAQTALCNGIKDDGEKAAGNRTIGAIVAGVGGAAVVGGLVWFFVAKNKSAEPSTALRVTPGPGLFGLGISGSF